MRCCLAIALCCLTACGGEREANVALTRVKVQRVAMAPFAAPVMLTGSVQARVQSELSFRLAGKLVERHVEVGESIKAGQLLARLDSQEQQNALATAEAALLAARASQLQYDADWRRQASLLPRGYTSRSEHDRARALLRSAEGVLRAAEAQLASAREQLAQTYLVSDADGMITARQAEVGQVVAAAAPVFSVALNGPRDAVFHVYEALFNQAGDDLDDIEVLVMRLDDPAIRSRGRVREVAPSVSERSGTLQVKVELLEQPLGMAPGAVVVVRQSLGSREQMLLPASALFSQAGAAAVWVLNEEQRVALQPVRVRRYSEGLLVLEQGLQSGQQVVVAGGQLLYPGQQVEIAAVLEVPQP